MQSASNFCCFAFPDFVSIIVWLLVGEKPPREQLEVGHRMKCKVSCEKSWESARNELNLFRTMITIPEFYSNRDILITGATGFVGKVLIEKLLRSCPSIGRVFCLLREKRSKSINERLDEIKSTPVSYLRDSHAVC